MKCEISERRGRNITTAYARVQFIRGTTLHVLVHIGNSSFVIVISLQQSSIKLSVFCYPISTVGLVYTKTEKQANRSAFKLDIYKKYFIEYVEADSVLVWCPAQYFRTFHEVPLVSLVPEVRAVAIFLLLLVGNIGNAHE
jgi:hypothetical protein